MVRGRVPAMATLDPRFSLFGGVRESLAVGGEFGRSVSNME